MGYSIYSRLFHMVASHLPTGNLSTSWDQLRGWRGRGLPWWDKVINEVWRYSNIWRTSNEIFYILYIYIRIIYIIYIRIIYIYVCFPVINICKLANTLGSTWQAWGSESGRKCSFWSYGSPVKFSEWFNDQWMGTQWDSMGMYGYMGPRIYISFFKNILGLLLNSLTYLAYWCWFAEYDITRNQRDTYQPQSVGHRMGMDNGRYYIHQ